MQLWKYHCLVTSCISLQRLHHANGISQSCAKNTSIGEVIIKSVHCCSVEGHVFANWTVTGYQYNISLNPTSHPAGASLSAWHRAWSQFSLCVAGLNMKLEEGGLGYWLTLETHVRSGMCCFSLPYLLQLCCAEIH